MATNTLYLFIIGILPSFVWFFFYLHEDEEHPEPPRTLFYAFVAGGVATFFTLGPQLAINNILSGIGIGQYSPISLTILAGIEEVMKFLAVYIVIAKRPEFDEPIDAMMYMVVAALGFAAVENVASALQGPTQGLTQAATLQVIALRFIGATLLHSLSSALVGYYWGLAMVAGQNYGMMIIEGIGVATVLHAAFNILILLYRPETLVATLFLIVASFFILNDFEKLKIHDR